MGPTSGAVGLRTAMRMATVTNVGPMVFSASKLQ